MESAESVTALKPIVLVTGLSGAGRSTALHVFEDLRLFTADGVPTVLIPDMIRLFRSPSMQHFRGMAIGLDLRGHDARDILEKSLHAVQREGVSPLLLFLEADGGVIIRRYAATRRPHPLEQDGVGLEKAVAAEAERLAFLREKADWIIDTTDYSVHDLRRRIQQHWKGENAHSVRVNVVSFGFKYGMPQDADMMFDLRCLPNPYFDERLRPLSGLDGRVAGYVFAEPSSREFRRRLIDFVCCALELCDAEGRYRCTVALGCTGGRHRSVAVAESLAQALRSREYAVAVEHRHMDREGSKM